MVCLSVTTNNMHSVLKEAMIKMFRALIMHSDKRGKQINISDVTHFPVTPVSPQIYLNTFFIAFPSPPLLISLYEFSTSWTGILLKQIRLNTFLKIQLKSLPKTDSKSSRTTTFPAPSLFREEKGIKNQALNITVHYCKYEQRPQ